MQCFVAAEILRDTNQVLQVPRELDGEGRLQLVPLLPKEVDDPSVTCSALASVANDISLLPVLNMKCFTVS